MAATAFLSNQPLTTADPHVAEIIAREEQRQQQKVSLIPSENFFSPAVREAVGSVFMHKYAEGNIGRRYYEGNQYVDELESLAIARARWVFRLPDDWDVNLQALAGSNANLAVYTALLEVGDTIMGMYLPDGGHLSHGWSYEPQGTVDAQTLAYKGGSRKVSLTSRIFRTIQYKTHPGTRQLDYDAVAALARQYRPQLIITGGTAYPRAIDHERMRVIADDTGAYYMADIAHEAGLVAGGAVPSPVGIADVVTLTTHKTLRAGRGAIVLAPRALIEKINRAVMPGLQGGPFNHSIAGICVGLGEAMTPAFTAYARQIVANARGLGVALAERGYQLVAGGTDKHLLLLDLTNKPLLGKKLARALDYAGIVTNFNTMPQETRPPSDPSAIRIGTPWVTTRGMQEGEMVQIAAWIDEVMTVAARWAALEFSLFEQGCAGSADLSRIAREVAALCARYPLPLKATVSSTAGV